MALPPEAYTHFHAYDVLKTITMVSKFNSHLGYSNYPRPSAM